MKALNYLIIISILFTSCKSSKSISNSNSIVVKEMSSKKVAKKHIAANFDKKTLDAKFKVDYKSAKENVSFSVQMKIKKDEVIWLKGKKFITVFKAKITPTSVSYYSPYKGDYFEGDFSLLKKILGTDITFKQLQNMLLGQAIVNLKGKKNTTTIQNNSYVLSPKSQSDLFHIFFHVNPLHYKLDKQSIVNSLKNQRLDIKYPTYSILDGTPFPDKIEIKTKESNKFTNITMTTRSVVFNTSLNLYFKIPTGYKRIKF